MDSENKEPASDDFGKVIDALHNKTKLSSLRTYQGDVAQFMRNKNESVISVAIKERRKKEEKEKTAPAIKSKTASLNIKINFTKVFLAFFLILGGVLVSFYIYTFVTKQNNAAPVIMNTEIIPYNNMLTLANIRKNDLPLEISKLGTSSGISIVKISDSSGNLIDETEDFFNFSQVERNLMIRRVIKNEFAFGVLNNSPFIVIKVIDFGSAFSAMLEWEGEMEKDLSFLIKEKFATSTDKIFIWKDLIIKNKDVRALANSKNEAMIGYTFLDKTTILITGEISIIGEISSSYSSRSVAR